MRVRRSPLSASSPYTTLFRSVLPVGGRVVHPHRGRLPEGWRSAGDGIPDSPVWRVSGGVRRVATTVHRRQPGSLHRCLELPHGCPLPRQAPVRKARLDAPPHDRNQLSARRNNPRPLRRHRLNAQSRTRHRQPRHRHREGRTVLLRHRTTTVSRCPRPGRYRLMAREFSKFNLAIWQDDDCRALPPPPQHLYMVLWTHPVLTYAGVVDWRPGRLAALAGGWTAEDVRTAADCLEARLFIVTDEDTEECLIRSWVRFDGLMKQPRMAVSFANAYAETASSEIRGVIIHELNKLHSREPDLAGWAKPQVADMLNLAQTDPRSRALPEDPVGEDRKSVV